MPRQTGQLPLVLPPRPPGVAAFRWLYSSLRRGILEGRLRPGIRLPATRELAREFGLSRGTIVAAFEQLGSEGYLEPRVGSGTYVARVLPGRLRGLTGRTAPRSPATGARRRRTSGYGRRLRHADSLRPGPIRAFRSNLPALDLFPTTLWAQVAARRLRRATAEDLRACGPMGYPPLQAAVADYLTTARGVQCGPEQVAIVSGVQAALDLTARLFLDPGDRVAIEHPGYLGAALVFEAFGATLVQTPLDDEGLTLDGTHLEGARLVYVTPAHQFPLGMAMSLPRRLALLEWARTSGGMIFEDDYDSEFRYAGHPMPALQGLDRQGQVLFAGSFGKVLFPSLRLGYLVVPADLVERFSATLSITSRHSPLLEQAVLCDFITAGHFGRHVRRMREVYGERLSVLTECAAERLAGLVEISEVEAGLQTVGWLRRGLDGDAATTAAARRSVEVEPIGHHGRGGRARHGLQLGFAAVQPAEIRRGVGDLARALEALPPAR